MVPGTEELYPELLFTNKRLGITHIANVYHCLPVDQMAKRISVE